MAYILDELLAGKKQIKASIDALMARIRDIEIAIEAYSEHNSIMFWELYKQPGEGLIDAKKRFFRSLSTDDDFMKLKQDGNRILLKKFVQLCDKLGLTYWLCAGSILGVVRHGGFIPWDDDIDVTMPRADYEKFIEYVKDDPEFRMVNWYNIFAGDMIAKLVFRDHVGIWFLDIYPCDDISSNYQDAARAYSDIKHKMIAELRNNEVLKPVLYNMVYDVYLDKQYLNVVTEIFNRYKKEFFGYIKERCGGSDTTAYVCSIENPENSMSQIGNYHLKSDVFPLKDETFDTIPVKVLNHYEEYLKSKYGDIYSLPKDIFTHIHVKNKMPIEQMMADRKFLEQFQEV